MTHRNGKVPEDFSKELWTWCVLSLDAWRLRVIFHADAELQAKERYHSGEPGPVLGFVELYKSEHGG